MMNKRPPGRNQSITFATRLRLRPFCPIHPSVNFSHPPLTEFHPLFRVCLTIHFIPREIFSNSFLSGFPSSNIYCALGIPDSRVAPSLSSFDNTPRRPHTNTSLPESIQLRVPWSVSYPRLASLAFSRNPTPTCEVLRSSSSMRRLTYFGPK